MKRTRNPLVAGVALTVAVLLATSGGCGSQKNGEDFAGADDASSDAQDDGASVGFGQGSATTGGFSAGTCSPADGLGCKVDNNCPGGKQTTITGKVYDPAGKNPLYNISVYVPNDPSKLAAITPGTNTCVPCMPISDYVALTQTAPDGSFTLAGVPSGKNIPLVVQVGKWRRVIPVANVADCATTAVPDSGSGQARLPRDQKEGDMPEMALLTGGLDDLGCFMNRMGIDASEYSAPQHGGRLDIYQGLGNAAGGGQANGPGLSTGKAGDCTNTSCPLWASKKSFESYDIVLLACEGDTYDADARVDGGINFGGTATNVTPVGKQAMHDWLNEGGKVFADALSLHVVRERTHRLPDRRHVAGPLGRQPADPGCDRHELRQGASVPAPGSRTSARWHRRAALDDGGGHERPRGQRPDDPPLDLRQRHRSSEVPVVRNADWRDGRRGLLLLRQGGLHGPARGRRSDGRRARELQGERPLGAREGARVSLLDLASCVMTPLRSSYRSRTGR